MYISSFETDPEEREEDSVPLRPECSSCTCCARGECKADGSQLCITPAGNAIMPWWECPCEVRAAGPPVDRRYGYVIVLDPEDGSEPWITHGTLEHPLSLKTATSLANFRAAVLRQNKQRGTYSLRAIEVRLEPIPDGKTDI